MSKQVKLEEFNYGHNLCPEDILGMWREMLCKVAVDLLREKTELEKKEEVMDPERADLLQCCRKKLQFSATSKGAGQTKADIMNAIRRKVRVIARKTTLSPAEEKVRMKLTWQDFDRMLWTCTLADQEELLKHVCDPEAFLNHAEDFVIEFEDEIGVFIGLKGWKTTVTEEANQQANKRKRLSTKTVEGVEKVKEAEKETALITVIHAR